MRATNTATDDSTRNRKELSSPTAGKLAHCLFCFGGLFMCFLVGKCMAWEMEKDFTTREVTAGMTSYRFAEWAGKTATNYTHTVTNWVADFGTTDVVNVRQRGNVSVETNETGVLARRRYEFSPKASTNQNWTCNIEEYPSVAEAQRMMLIRFLSNNSPTYRPRPGVQEGIRVGDVCFVRSAFADRGRVLYFCRNNVFVEVSVGGTNYSPCVTIANHLDAQIVEKSLAE